jgi:hypothetical protein
MTDSPEKRKLALKRLRRMRALAKQRKLQAEKGAGGGSEVATPGQPPRAEKAARTTKAPTNDARVKEVNAHRQQEIEALERDISELSRLTEPADTTAEEIGRIRREVEELKRDFYSHLDSWQRLQLARHPQRP